MSAAITDLLTQVGQPGTVTSMASPGKAIGASSINVGSTANWPTGTAVFFAIRQVDPTQVSTTNPSGLVAGTYTEWKGIVASGSIINNLTLQFGTDQVYPAGSNTQVFVVVSAARENAIVQWGTAEHNQNGTHAAITPTSVTSAGTIQGAAVISTGDLQIRSTSLEQMRTEYDYNFIASGCIWTGAGYGSSLAASMTAGVVYINGRRLTVAAISNHAFSASVDTYVDFQDNGDGTAKVIYTTSTNNGSSPAIPNSLTTPQNVRNAIIVTGTSIAAAGSINQGNIYAQLPLVTTSPAIPMAVCDTIGNLIYPTPGQKIIGFRNYPTSSGPSSSSTSPVSVAAGLNIPVLAANCLNNGKITCKSFARGVTTNSGTMDVLFYIGSLAGAVLADQSAQNVILPLAMTGYAQITANTTIYLGWVTGAGTMTIQAYNNSFYVAVERD